MTDVISWVATATTIIAACMTAANLGSRVTGYGFAVFTVGAACWIAAGAMTHQPALVWSNIVLAVLDVFGVWRWLGHQARVEEGAHSAAEASEHTPGEALFPVSLLTRAEVQCGGERVGSCVDAMAGCATGKLAYVVVSEGGVAGVGETLWRLPWSAVQVDSGHLIAKLRHNEIESLEELPKDNWPGR
jgi:hypothetical protein